MVMYVGQNGKGHYYPPSEIGCEDGQSEVTVQKRDHEFEHVMLGERQGRKCKLCGYEELTLFFGKTPPCPGKRG